MAAMPCFVDAGKERVAKSGAAVRRRADPDHDQTARHPLLQLQRHAGNQSVQQLMRSPNGGAVGAGMRWAPAAVHEVLRSPGRPLDASTRHAMEARLGRDFSSVRIHTDGKAADSASFVHARAYTVGDSIAFGEGQYAPETEAGQTLLAHELAHTVQQGSMRRAGSDALEISDPGDASEREAREISTGAERGSGILSSQKPHVARDDHAAQQADAKVDAGIVGYVASEVREDKIEGSAPIHLERITQALSRLPMKQILATLIEVGAQADVVNLRVRYNDYNGANPRIWVALHTLKWTSAESSHVADDEAMQMSSFVQQLAADDQATILDYLKVHSPLLQSGMSLEGFAAMMEAQSGAPAHTPADQDAPLEAGANGGAGVGSFGPVPGSTTPPPIEPAPWRPPGGQFPGLYIGNEAHKAITEVYETAHMMDMTHYNTVPLSYMLSELAFLNAPLTPDALTKNELAVAPDIANLSRRHVYEIKPVQYLSLGLAEAQLYVSLFNRAGYTMSLGPVGEPGTKGAYPAPNGIYFFESPVPGVIVYQYRSGQFLSPVSVLQPEGETVWRYELKPWQKAAIAGTTIGIGGMLLIALMALAAA